mmetsp:Transcript_18605/g.28970  ORF Transcript_18605/g.28970 Transcript_18605/m.28970 type:complete len:181 (+) Transcript_18605:293-835(+)
MASGGEVSYVPGMNAICGILLLEVNEIDSVAIVLALRERHCPLYLHRTLDAVHVACDLIDEVLGEVDSQLASHLDKCKLQAKIYAFPWVLSLGTCFPPLSEAIKLLDFLFVQGVHAIVLCAAARVQQSRSLLLGSDKPMPVLQRLPPIDAKELIKSARQIYEQIKDSGLRERLESHPYLG